MVTSQFGYYFFYTIKQQRIRREVKQQILATLADNSFEIIVAEDNAGKIRWEEDGKEFHLNGEMYDVAKISYKNGKTLLHCLNDKKEKQLLHDWAKATKTNTNNNSSDKGKLNIKFHTADFIVEDNFPKTYSPAFSSCLFALINAPLISVVTDISTPPPEA